MPVSRVSPSLASPAPSATRAIARRLRALVRASRGRTRRGRWFRPVTALALAAGTVALAAAASAGPSVRVEQKQADPRFVDHGIAAQVAECRGIVAAHTQDGRDLVLANTSDMSPRGYVLITDIRSGRTDQLYCPEGVANSPPYAAILASNGRFYTAQGPVLLELDPATASWRFHGVPSPDAAAYLAFTEGPDGRIWAASVYGTVLVSFDPASRLMTDHGRLDPEEQYVFDLAVDDTGWVYAGVGTARGDIVAYNPFTGELRGVVPEPERTHESGVVYPTIDGAAVGKANEVPEAIDVQVADLKRFPAEDLAMAAPVQVSALVSKSFQL